MARFAGNDLASRPQWLERRERGSFAAMRMLAWLTFAFGRRAGRTLLGPICLYFLVFSLRARRASRDYLQRVLGRPAGLADLLRHYHSFASTLHDRLFLLAGRRSEFDVSLYTTSEAERWLCGERGCILLGAHFGSFEILRTVGAASHYRPINVVMHTDNAAKTNRLVDSIAPELRSRIIPLGRPESLLRVRDCLSRGEVVGMLGDRLWRNERAVTCEFLGARARFPTGPLLLAALLGVPVILFFGVYQGGRRYEIRLEPFAERVVIDPGRREVALQSWVEAYAQRLEAQCRLAPYNWFNFYDFWE